MEVMIAVSLIIPIYNAESYIRLMLKDLSLQTFKNAEYLLIDDGSTDRTKEIIETWMNNSNDNRFKLISKQNGGVSSARNRGVELAKGKYMIFVDSDDRLCPNFVEKYVTSIEKLGTDMEVFSAIKVSDNKTLSEDGRIDYRPIASNKIITPKDYILYFSDLKAWGYPFCYIVKKSIWGNVKFKDNIKYQEDVLALFMVWVRHPGMRIHINADAYYYYYIRNNSALRGMKTADYWQFVEVDDLVINELSGEASLSPTVPYILALKSSSLMTVIATAVIEDKSADYNKARKMFLETVPEAKIISFKIKLRRRLQWMIVKLNLKYVIRRVYGIVYD